MTKPVQIKFMCSAMRTTVPNSYTVARQVNVTQQVLLYPVSAQLSRNYFHKKEDVIKYPFLAQKERTKSQQVKRTQRKKKKKGEKTRKVTNLWHPSERETNYFQFAN